MARLRRRLPIILSLVAGLVDVIGYLSLGKLFAAHVTGNIVIVGAQFVLGGRPNLAQMLAVPVFAVAVAVVSGIAKLLRLRGVVLARSLLLAQFLLLAAVLVFSVRHDADSTAHEWVTTVAAMIAVSAMACQFTLLRFTVPGTPSTAVMTGNLTESVLSLMDTWWRREPRREGAEERLRKSVVVLAGFFAGCLAGAGAVSWLGNWAWSLPVALAGIALAIA
ncbi:MAG: YoaK family protein [Candidatus Eiseniibacteriota bacterium]